MTKEMAGEGVIVMEFEKHRKHRKLLSGPFSTSSIKRLESVFASKAEELTQLFDRAIAAGANNSSSTGVIDCTQTFSKTTLDVMGITVLGVDLGNLAATTFSSSSSPTSTNESNNKKTQQQHHHENHEYSFHDAYEAIFVQDTLGKFLVFGNGFIPLRWLPLKPNRDFLFATSWLDNYLTSLFRKRKEEIAKAIEDGKHEVKGSRDLLSFLIEEGFSEGGLQDDSTEKELVGDVSIYIPNPSLLFDKE